VNLWRGCNSEEPEIPYEEKLRLMKKRREEEKQARLDAEDDAIDLYEQVGWMNRYEVKYISFSPLTSRLVPLASVPPDPIVILIFNRSNGRNVTG